MRDLFQRFVALLRPAATQQNHGQGSIQAAKVKGNVHVHNNRTTHVHIAVRPPDPSPNAIPIAPPRQSYAPAITPARSNTAPRRARPDQAQAVAQYKNLTDTERRGLDEMMRREFGTNTILELDEGQISRIMGYMNACIKKRPKTRAAVRAKSRAWRK